MRAIDSNISLFFTPGSCHWGKTSIKLGAVAGTCSPSVQKAKVEGPFEFKSLKPAWAIEQDSKGKTKLHGGVHVVRGEAISSVFFFTVVVAVST